MSDKPYINAIRSKEAIKKALRELVKEKKDINAISVSDITKRAGINRCTFYNHYKNIGEILDELEDNLLNDFVLCLESAMDSTDDFGETLINDVTKKLKDKMSKYEAVIDYIPSYVFVNLQHKFLDAINNHYLKEHCVDQQKRAQLYILATGISTCFVAYFKGKLRTSFDELAKTSVILIKKCL